MSRGTGYLDFSPAPRRAADGSPIYTVTELTREIRNALERHIGTAWVTGEIANLRQPASGHCYFTIKDESSQLSAVMWRTMAEVLPFEIKDGISVIVHGEISVDEPRGQYQLVVRRLEPLGVGPLQLAFLQLRDRLAKEGLFDPDRKRSLPALPQLIAIVTSPTGAAIQDMIKTIQTRYPPARILLCPARVQGAEAAAEIAEAIRMVNRHGQADVLIVGRGGGSLEDLWAFNEEVVARAIAASKIPVVSAVGHETDVTISDFVADVRALTPTDAGNLVVPEMRQLLLDLSSSRARLAGSLTGMLQTTRQRLDGLARHFHPRHATEMIRRQEQRMDDLCQQLLRNSRHLLDLQKHRLQGASGRLESLSPLRVLARGYSVTLEKNGKVLKEASRLKPGDRVRTRLWRGSFDSTVETVQDTQD